MRYSCLEKQFGQGIVLFRFLFVTDANTKVLGVNQDTNFRWNKVVNLMNYIFQVTS